MANSDTITIYNVRTKETKTVPRIQGGSIPKGALRSASSQGFFEPVTSRERVEAESVRQLEQKLNTEQQRLNQLKTQFERGGRKQFSGTLQDYQKIYGTQLARDFRSDYLKPNRGETAKSYFSRFKTATRESGRTRAVILEPTRVQESFITPKVDPINKRLSDIDAQLRSGLVKKESIPRLIEEQKQLNKLRTSSRENEINLPNVRLIGFPTELKNIIRKDLTKYTISKYDSPEQKLNKTYSQLIEKSNYINTLKIINSKEYKKYIKKQASIEEIAKQYNDAKIKLDIAKRENRPDLVKKYEKEIRKTYFKGAYNRLINTTTKEKWSKFNELLSKEKGWNLFIDLLDNSGKADKKTYQLLAKDWSKTKRGIKLINIGIKRIPIKTIKLLTALDSNIPTKELRQRPADLIRNISINLILADLIPSLIKKGLASNKIVSALTQVGLKGNTVNFANSFIKGYKNADNKENYITDQIATQLMFSALIKNKGGYTKTFSFKETFAKLSPFYKAKLIELGYPQTTSKRLLTDTIRKGEKGNFYHVTTGKYKDFIKDNILTIMSQKTGMGKDRIKFNEDFLYVSDKGLVQYGLKGVKPVIEFKLNTEAMKLYKGELKKYRSSDILKKIQIEIKKKHQGNLKIKDDIDRFVIEQSARDGSIIGGQRASNIQLKSKYQRNTLDWDLKSKNPKQTALEIMTNLDKTQYQLKTLKTPDGIVYRIYDTKSKQFIVDVGKITHTIKTIKIGDSNFADISYLIDRKISTLVDKQKVFRWNKDLTDLKNQLKSTGNYKNNKILIDSFEKKILKGEVDITQAKTILREFKDLGLNKKTVDFLLNAKKNPLKYGLLKILSKPILAKKPETYKIFEFYKVNIAKYPPTILNRINQVNKGLLSSKQQIQLRIDINNFLKKNPSLIPQVGAGSKTLSGISVPYGLEEEWMIAPKSQFVVYKNIRSKFYNLFGLKKGESITYDPMLDKVQQIYRVTDPKNLKTKQSDIKEFFNLLKQRYKNPKKLLYDIFKNNPTINSPEGLKKEINLRTLNNIQLLNNKYISSFRQNNNIFSDRTSLKPILTNRRTILSTTIKRNIITPITRKIIKLKIKNRISSPITRRLTPKITLQRVKNRIPTRKIESRIPTPRTTQTRVTPRAVQPRIPTPRIITRPIIRTRPPIRPPEITTPRPPNKKNLTLKLSKKIKKAIKKIKLKGKKPMFQYTPTLAGEDIIATRTTGQFSGFEVRGNIIKLKPILVHKHKRKTLVNKRFVRRHHRKKPIRRN